MKKILSLLTVITVSMVWFTSCYNNKYDILELSKVSFSKEVVPIMTSGPCGCHNSIVRARNRWIQFTDTLTGQPAYNTIFAKMGMMEEWAKGKIGHPAGGDVFLSAADSKIILDWVAQGKINDYVPPAVSGAITYTSNVSSIVKSTCSGGSCHTTTIRPLTYDVIKNNSSKLQTMANSSNSAKQPGGSFPLKKKKKKIILDWITQGMKQ